jgi:hypothetical protein
MRLEVVLLLIFVVGTSFERSKGDISTTTDELRLLQNEQYLYRSRYRAEFQHLTDAGCTGDPPVLLLTCSGPSLTILNTSDDSIVCSPLGQARIENGTTFQCVNTCADCQNVYRFASSDNVTAQQGPFESITFRCEGNSIDNIGAGFEVLGENTLGTCSASSETKYGRNFHLARLGVSCPVLGSTTMRQYVFDDTYFDCLSPNTFSVDLSPDQSTQEDIFACVTGKACQGQACDFLFSNLLVTSSVSEFYDACVESSVPITAFPTPAPASTPFEYSVLFEASWGQLYDSYETYLACSTESPDILISCDNGAVIEYVNSTDVNMRCFNLLDSQLSCLANGATIKNLLVSVFYVSTWLGVLREKANFRRQIFTHFAFFLSSRIVLDRTFRRHA